MVKADSLCQQAMFIIVIPVYGNQIRREKLRIPTHSKCPLAAAQPEIGKHRVGGRN